MTPNPSEKMEARELDELRWWIAKNVIYTVDSPCTDPAAAIEVLERILDSGKQVQSYKGVTRSGDRVFVFTAKGGYHEEAPTLPLAICRFAKAIHESEGKRCAYCGKPNCDTSEGAIHFHAACARPSHGHGRVNMD